MTLAHRAPGSLENGVLFGKNDQLFLADGGHAVLDFALGKRSVSNQSISQFAINILSRRETTQRRDVPYVHIIFPDKQSVLTDSFPFPNPVCLGEVYLQAAPALADVVLYPRDMLRAAGDAVFQKTDTHLTDFGTAIATRCVLDHLFGRSHASEIDAVIADINVPMEWVGDLGQRFKPNLVELRQTLRCNHPVKWFHNDLKGGSNGLVDLVFNKDALYGKRLLIFGDSFGRELARFLSLFIREIVFLRTPFFHLEMFDQIQPDLVVTDNVERYLSWSDADDTRPPFLLYPFRDDRNYSPSKEFVEAFSAILSFPRKPYQEFCSNWKY